MDFELGKGFSAEGNRGTVDLSRQSKEFVLAAFFEARDVAMQHDWLSQTTVEELESVQVQPEAELDQRERLLGSLSEGARLYRSVIETINNGRGAEDQIPVLKDEEYLEQAETWLTPERLETAGQLPKTAERPLLLVPRLNREVTHEEILRAWDNASDNGLYKWRGQLEFLKKFPANQLSGYDPELGNEAGFVILPTAYDSEREGTRDTQLEDLQETRGLYPSIEVAPVLDGAILASRYKGKERDWRDSYVRSIDADPVKVDHGDCVVGARVGADGRARVGYSSVRGDGAARRRVR